MISDAYVRVTCNGCETEEEIPLTATAKGYDDRNLKRDIEKLGWKMVGENVHHCADCLTPGDEE
jgi:hypothetical protein